MGISPAQVDGDRPKGFETVPEQIPGRHFHFGGRGRFAQGGNQMVDAGDDHWQKPLYWG
ncbi:MAG: hypothetical protein RBR20_14620 [Desulfobacterales bacterium]|nr:hypothetical protein [Desulfobacteraceae bacterium]MDY0313347.1 hypothetical protein [Desulfobacterales bacterium]